MAEQTVPARTVADSTVADSTVADSTGPEVPELDLSAPPTPPDRPEGAPPSRLRRVAALWPKVALALAGALVGGLVVHVVHVSAPPSEGAVTVALGEFGARRLNQRIGTRRAVLFSAVAVNRTGGALVVQAVRAEGQGARLTKTYRGESSIFPLHLAPGETANMPFVISADCAVASGNDAPQLSMVLGPPGGPTRTLPIRIPDLERIWQATLSPENCQDVT